MSECRTSPDFIGVFDSGVGGLSVWREIARQLPHENTCYVADQAHVPYGSRSLDEVRAFSEAIARFLIARGAKVIVIACNTICAAALYYLRNLFPDVPIVGMEPAVKPAAERTRVGVVGVMATQTTFQGKLFASLLQRYARGIRVVTEVGSGLVEAVEAGALDAPQTEALLRKHLAPLMASGADQLVLGCTHYPFLFPLIERIVAGRMAVIDPAPAVARQTGRVLTREGLQADAACVGRHVFYTSGDVDAFAATVDVLLPSFARDTIHIRAVHWHEGCLKTTGVSASETSQTPIPGHGRG